MVKEIDAEKEILRILSKRDREDLSTKVEEIDFELMKEYRELLRTQAHSLYLVNVPKDYTVVLTDRSIDFPFKLNSRLVNLLKNYVEPFKTKLERAYAIYEWIVTNIEYDSDEIYKDSIEVLIHKKGKCADMSFLYVAMARAVGLKSQIVDVYVDCYGKEVSHACAIVEVEGGSILVDPAYQKFGVRHLRWKVQSDWEVISWFLEGR